MNPGTDHLLPNLWPEMLMLCWLAAAAVIDARRRVVPNALIIVGLALSSVLLIAFSDHRLEHAGAALAGGGGLLLLRALGSWWRGQPGVGLGDVKLAFVLGLGIGPVALLILWAGCMLAGIYGIAGLAARRLSRDARLPLVPFFFAAGLIVVWLQPSVIISPK